MLNKILTGVYLLIGLYFTYSGIVKKGKMYDNSNIAKEKKRTVYQIYVAVFGCERSCAVRRGRDGAA